MGGPGHAGLLPPYLTTSTAYCDDTVINLQINLVFKYLQIGLMCLKEQITMKDIREPSFGGVQHQINLLMYCDRITINSLKKIQL